MLYLHISFREVIFEADLDGLVRLVVTLLFAQILFRALHRVFL